MGKQHIGGRLLLRSSLSIMSVVIIASAAVSSCADKRDGLRTVGQCIWERLIFTMLPVMRISAYPDNQGVAAVSASVSDELYYMSYRANSDSIIVSGGSDFKNIDAADTSKALANSRVSASVVAAGVEPGAAIKGPVYDKSKLMNRDFLRSFYTVTSITNLTNDILKPVEFLNKDLSLAKDSDKPQILIFHTHSQESFVDSGPSDESGTIVGVGEHLAEILRTRYGYNVYHDKSVYDYVDGRLDRSRAYTYAEQGVERILKENPSIQVVIDLHRDGVDEDVKMTTQIDGKSVAKVMLFNGLSYSNVNGDINYLPNPNRDDNLAMSLQMKLIGDAYYPGWLRNIYINAYRYCLHLRGRSLLVEAGAQTNTVAEVKNAMEPLADILDKLLSGVKVY